MSTQIASLNQAQDRTLLDLNERLEQLKIESEIQITDQATLTCSAGVKVSIEQFIRAAEAHFEPELAPAEEKVMRLKLQLSTLVTPAKAWLKALVDRQRAWMAKEKEAAQKEATKISKKNGAPVTVAPAIPTVPGLRNQTYYFAEVVDADRLIDAYHRAKGDSAKFLRRFITVNEKEVGAYARETKDSNAVQNAIPGVKAYSKG